MGIFSIKIPTHLNTFWISQCLSEPMKCVLFYRAILWKCFDQYLFKQVINSFIKYEIYSYHGARSELLLQK